MLNQYRVDAFVAPGGMGAVYRVWDLKRNVPLAMKVLHSDLEQDPQIFKSFQREANALKKLSHPNIVQFYGFFHTLDIVFLLERFVDGPSLKTVLHKKKLIALQEALVYLKALCSALGYAHANHVVHCDVKPGNVLIDQGGHIYLADFGIARHADSTTTTMATAGTAAYMAPEQILGKPVTPAADVYALGVMLFEMLTGQRPFTGTEKETEKGGRTANERIRYAHLHLQPPNPSSLNANISAELSQVILQSLYKNSVKRYSGVQKFFIAVCKAVAIDTEKIPDRAELVETHANSRVSAPESSNISAASPRNLVLDKKYFVLFGGLILLMIATVVIVLGINLGPSRESSPATSPPLLYPSSQIAGYSAHTAVVTAGVINFTPTAESTSTSIVNNITSSIDNAMLIRIPEGMFLRGFSEEQVDELLAMCPGCEREAVSDAMPQKQIYLDEFWIDQTEVTNAQFSHFVSDTGYITSAEQKTYKISYVYKFEFNDFIYDANASWEHPHGSSFRVAGLDNTPVTQISWEDANAYCQWAGRRLPTEAEWEKAARGTEGGLFVWGDEPPGPVFLNSNLISNGPRPVGSYLAGASPYHLYDMAGNLWEWVADFYSENYYSSAPDRNPTGPQTGDGHSLRGGSWASEYEIQLYYITPSWRFWNYPNFSSDVLGFRCAMSSP